MSSKKKIVINPEYLAGSGSILKKKKKNKTQKKNIVSSKFSNAKQRQTKKQLIDRIKKHKKMQDLINTSKKMKNMKNFKIIQEAVSFEKQIKKTQIKKGGVGAYPQINMIITINTQPGNQYTIMTGSMDDNGFYNSCQQPAIIWLNHKYCHTNSSNFQNSVIQQQLLI